MEVSGSIPFDKIIVGGGLKSEVIGNTQSSEICSHLKNGTSCSVSISSHFLGCVFITLHDAFLEKYGHQNWMDTYEPGLSDAEYAQYYVACVYWVVATVPTIGPYAIVEISPKPVRAYGGRCLKHQ